jgi:hypothetical protein
MTSDHGSVISFLQMCNAVLMDCCYTPSGKKVLHAPCRGTLGTGIITGKRDEQENGREGRANGKARDMRYLFTEMQMMRAT